MSETVYIEKLAYGGSGIGKLPGGKIVFVEGAYPGELIEVDVISEKKDFAIGTVKSFIERIPERRRPVCPYFRECGGCDFLDINYKKQLELKEEIVKDQLKRIAGISSEFLDKIQSSNLEYEYRLKMEFSFGFNGKTILGLKKKNSNKVVEVKKCHISPKQFDKVLNLVPEIVDLYKVPVYKKVKKGQRGILKHLVLRYSPTENSLMTIFITKTEKFEAAKNITNYLLKKIPYISSVVHVMNSSDKVILRGPYKILKGDGILTYDFDWEKFQVPPTAFFQNNYFVTGKMIEFLTKKLELKGNEKVLDLYSGLGTFSIRLAALVKHVTAVESSHVAVKAGRANANINNLRNIKFVESAVEEFLDYNEEKYDVVVLDPPRSGAGVEVVKKIIEIAPEKIGYISCNPSTLARDLSLFLQSGKYDIQIIRPFDMFPQTYHIETITILKKRG
ncbi:MAG: 23S rRNA (uracil(1939)-C(5))-methyltransferase RlmD [Thermosipho sp. (in: Bacteria)]|nr:23S rRNA (uracil(1939)-C(5))-methyltransferase RlmD [Thermosipho sp. (in: thermotogales)]